MRKLAESPSIAVERALAMLERVADASNGLSNSELARALDIPKSSASYILRTLERRGYLSRDRESGRYRLGLRILSLSRGVMSHLDIRQIALPHLKAVVEKTHLTCHLAILDAGEAVYVEKVDAPGFIKMDTWVGRRMKVHSTSVGKSLVAWLPEDEVLAILERHGMERRTPKTIVTARRYVSELQRVRDNGFAVDDEENNPGARCVGVPIFDAPNHVAAALGLSGTSSQVTRDNVSKLAEILRDAARRISRQLGYEATRK